MREKRGAIPETVREAVLQKTGGLCAYCGCRLLPGWHVDHILPFTKGGTIALENLLPACPSCNTRKGVHNLGKFRDRTSARVLHGLLDALDVLYWSQSFYSEEAFADLHEITEALSRFAFDYEPSFWFTHMDNWPRDRQDKDSRQARFEHGETS